MSIFVARPTIAARIAAALLPQDCYVCGSASEGALLCQPCLHALPRLVQDRCPVCALPAPGGALCGACLKSPPHFDATLAVFEYAFPVQELVQALKYGARLAVAPFLGGELARTVAGLEFDAILPLPLHPARLALRGFNQAVELARPAARQLARPLWLDAASRETDNRPQAELPWSERRSNVRNVFGCAADMSGKSVFVVDDVMTTGATLDEFARTLKKHGAARVVNGVIARTPPPS